MYKILIIMTLLFSTTLQAEIIEAANPDAIQWAVEQAQPDSLVLFDIGEVLLTCEDVVLHNEYLSWVNEWSKNEAPHLTADDWKKLQVFIDKDAKKKVVNPRLKEIIKKGQSKIKMIALSRYWVGPVGDTSFEKQRLAALQSIGIDFGDPFSQMAGWGQESPASSYANGIILTEASLKGPVLKAFLDELKWRPTTIVFVDDKIKQCRSVLETAKELGIPAICIHYTESDNQLPPLNPEVADLQLHTLVDEQRWISDEEALRLLKSQ